MIGLVMCGGRGSRMKIPQEKLLLKYKKPIIMNVISAMKESGCFSKVIAATSQNAPETREFLIKSGIDTIDTPGNGYVNDLSSVLNSLKENVFVTAGDLPLLDGDVIRRILEISDFNNTWTTILVSKEYLDSYHLKSDYYVTLDNKQCCYSGISLVNPTKIEEMRPVQETYLIFDDKRIAVNLNTKGDYELLCAS